MGCQVKLPGVMQGVGARSRPPSQRWFAKEMGKDERGKGKIREIKQVAAHICKHKSLVCVNISLCSLKTADIFLFAVAKGDATTRTLESHKLPMSWNQLKCGGRLSECVRWVNTHHWFLSFSRKQTVTRLNICSNKKGLYGFQSCITLSNDYFVTYENSDSDSKIYPDSVS